jgi:hypothetical protein
MMNAFDAYLKRTLKKAVSDRVPPADGRARLLRSANKVRARQLRQAVLPGLFFASPFFSVDQSSKLLHPFVIQSIEQNLLANRLAV